MSRSSRRRQTLTHEDIENFLIELDAPPAPLQSTSFGDKENQTPDTINTTIGKNDALLSTEKDIVKPHSLPKDYYPEPELAYDEESVDTTAMLPIPMPDPERDLIREYVSKLFSSNQGKLDYHLIDIGKSILETTTYKLVPHIFTNPEEYIHPLGSKTAQRSLLISLSPQIQEAESQRKMDEVGCVEFTRCKAVKIRKPGSSFSYVDIDENVEISPEEYEERYRQYIYRDRLDDIEDGFVEHATIFSKEYAQHLAAIEQRAVEAEAEAEVEAEAAAEREREREASEAKHANQLICDDLLFVASNSSPLKKTSYSSFDYLTMDDYALNDPSDGNNASADSSSCIDNSFDDSFNNNNSESNCNPHKRHKKSKSTAKMATRRETLSPNSARAMMLSLLCDDDNDVEQTLTITTTATTTDMITVAALDHFDNNASAAIAEQAAEIDYTDTEGEDISTEENNNIICESLSEDYLILQQFNKELNSLMSGSFMDTMEPCEAEAEEILFKEQEEEQEQILIDITADGNDNNNNNYNNAIIMNECSAICSSLTDVVMHTTDCHIVDIDSNCLIVGTNGIDNEGNISVSEYANDSKASQFEEDDDNAIMVTSSPCSPIATIVSTDNDGHIDAISNNKNQEIAMEEAVEEMNNQLQEEADTATEIRTAAIAIEIIEEGLDHEQPIIIDQQLNSEQPQQEQYQEQESFEMEQPENDDLTMEQDTEVDHAIAIVDVIHTTSALATEFHDAPLPNNDMHTCMQFPTTNTTNMEYDSELSSDIEISAEEAKQAAMQRLTIRIDIARWKYHWELVSFEAAQQARNSKRKR